MNPYTFTRNDINLTPSWTANARQLLSAGPMTTGQLGSCSPAYTPEPSFNLSDMLNLQQLQCNSYCMNMMMAQQMQIQYLQMAMMQQMLNSPCFGNPYGAYQTPQPMMMPNAPWMNGGCDAFDSYNYQDPFAAMPAPALPAQVWQPPSPVLQVGQQHQVATVVGNPNLNAAGIPQAATITQIGGDKPGALQQASVQNANAFIQQTAVNPQTNQTASVDNGTAVIEQKNGKSMQAFVQGDGAAHIDQQAAGNYNNLQASFGKGGGTCNQVGNMDVTNNFFVNAKNSQAGVMVNQTSGRGDDFFGIEGGQGNDTFNLNTGSGNDRVNIRLSGGQDTYNIGGDGQTTVQINPMGQDFKVVDDQGRVLHDGSGSTIRVKAGTQVNIFEGGKIRPLS